MGGFVNPKNIYRQFGGDITIQVRRGKRIEQQIVSRAVS